MPSNIPSIADLLKKTRKDEIKTKAESDKTAPEKFEERMSEIGIKEKEQVAMTNAQTLGVPYIQLRGFAISPDALSLISQEVASSAQVAPFFFTGPELRLGAVNPQDERVREIAFQISDRNNTNAVIYQISADSLEYALELYKALPQIKKIIKGVRITEEEISAYRNSIQHTSDAAKLLTSTSTSEVMTIIVAAALQFDSSDIHIEAEKEGIKVRFRIDGVLQDIAELPKESWVKIIARIKLISGLKINVTNRPQDGRFTIFLKNGNVDVRVSSLPTNWGESVVMRILKPSAISVSWENLGFRERAFTKLERELKKPHGMILTTGPTGSGKTTTLYAMLRKLNLPGVKIITLEDPIEYKLEGINQSQVDAGKDYTFAGGLRSILRQDPDIVMVGEIRDFETADTAVNAALTGHLLLSTVHTNDASGAIPRLVNMGVKPFLLVQAINAIIGQRLVRKLCQNCKIEENLGSETLSEIKLRLNEIPETSGERISSLDAIKFYKAGVGCEKCNGGYKGRVGIYEILIMNSDVETIMKEGIVTENQMREIATKQGMVTMYQDGLLKALDGLTSIEEVNRVAIT
jgi:type IV pilus assembly protein PilB